MRSSNVLVFAAAALLLAACAEHRVYMNSSGTYTTTPFPVTPQTILRVEDMHVGDEGLVLYVEVGVCGKPQEQLLPVYVHGAPRGVFHVGQTIAQGSIRVKRGFEVGIRVVSAGELQQLGCTLAND